MPPHHQESKNMTNLNLKPINTALSGSSPAKDTEIVWVAISDGLSSQSIAWYQDKFKHYAEAVFNNDKNTMPVGMQALLFSVEIEKGLTKDKINEIIDNFYTDYGYSVEFINNENVMSAPLSTQDWTKKVRTYENKHFIGDANKPIEPSMLLCHSIDEYQSEITKLQKRNIKPFVKSTDSGIHLVWSEHKANTLFFVYFDTLNDVGLMLNGQLISYVDCDNDQIRHLATTLEKSLDIKMIGAKFFMPESEDWADWNWDMVAEVMNKPDFDGLVSLHSLVDSNN